MNQTREDLLITRTKLENAIAFGVQGKGNLEWAKAMLARVNELLAR